MTTILLIWLSGSALLVGLMAAARRAEDESLPLEVRMSCES